MVFSFNEPVCNRLFPREALKDQVFQRRIMTIQAHKQAIINEVTAIDQGLWRRVNNYFQKRFQECIDDINRGRLPKQK